MVSKEVQESVKRSRILEAILVSSTSRESFRFPAKKEYILSELVNATIECLGGKPRKVTYSQFHGYFTNIGEYEKRLLDYFETEVSKLKKEIHPDLIESIRILTGSKLIPPSCGLYEPELKCELYEEIDGTFGLCRARAMESSFSLTQAVLFSTESFLEENSEYREDIINLGKVMRKHIDKDFKEMKKRNKR